MVRTDHAVGKVFTPGHDNVLEVNDFNEEELFKLIGDVQNGDSVEIRGERHTINEPYGGRYVLFPLHYQYVRQGDGFVEKKVSMTQYPGFVMPECFKIYDANGVQTGVRPYILYGKYEATVSDDTLRLGSEADKYPVVNQNIGWFRSHATANNVSGTIDGYFQTNWSIEFMINNLAEIMFGTLNMQAYLQGWSAGRRSTSDIAQTLETATNAVILTTTSANNYRVGQPISLGDGQDTYSIFGQRIVGTTIYTSRSITAITTITKTDTEPTTPVIGQYWHNTASVLKKWNGEAWDTLTLKNAGTNALSIVTFDGEAVDYTDSGKTYYLNNAGWKTGFSKHIESRNGYLTANDGRYPCVSFGLENFRGSVWKFVDGMNIQNGNVWLCNNPKQMNSNVFANPYYKIPGTLPAASNSYIKQMNYAEKYPLVELPLSVAGGSATTFYSDALWTNLSGNFIALVGAQWGNGASVGFSAWHLSDASSNAGESVGGRQVIMPFLF
jgi:hypothetical protein